MWGIILANFSERFSGLLDVKGIPKKVVAELLGVTYRTINNYENGQREPSLEQVGKLADFFGVSVDYLAGKSDDPQLVRAEARNTTPAEAEFLRWVEENVSDVFFYEFDKSPDTSKAQLMKDLRYMWEREKKATD